MSREPLLTRPFLFVCAAQFLFSVSFNIFLHLPGFLEGVGASEVDIGLIVGVMGATAIASRPPLGRALDTIGRRAVILAGGVVNTVVCALYLTVHSIGPWVYAVRVVHGVADSMLFTGFFALTADIVPASRRIEGLALFGVSALIPISLGGLLGDDILSRWAYPQLFMTAAALGAASLTVSLPLREPVRDPTLAPSRGILAAFLQHDLRPVWLVGISFALALAAYYTFLKTFVLSTSIGSVGVFFTAYASAAITIRLLFGRLPDRFGPKRVLLPALGSLAAGLALLPLAWSAAGVGIAGVLCGIGHGYAYPILVGMVVARARGSERGAALAIYTALFDAGALVGGPFFGLLIHRAGYTAMFACASAIVVAGAAAFAVWDRERTAEGLATANEH